MIGAGNLATQFAKACLRAGHDILQVFSRTAEAANVLSQQVGGAPVTDVNLLTYDADVYVFALRDSALGEMIPKVCHGREQHVFLHTAGSVPMSVFEGMALHYGVLYPLQTFPRLATLTLPAFPASPRPTTTLPAIRWRNLRRVSLSMCAPSVANSVNMSTWQQYGRATLSTIAMMWLLTCLHGNTFPSMYYCRSSTRPRARSMSCLQARPRLVPPSVTTSTSSGNSPS